MRIRVKGARENNLKNIEVELEDGLTVVTGISGSGKTSLIFDTIYNEARRRFLEIHNMGREVSKLNPSQVESISGIGPTIAVEQNLLNRNPNSTLASATGMHPFLRILFTRFGVRHCPVCGIEFNLLTEDEIVQDIQREGKKAPSNIAAVLVRKSKGSHKALLQMLDRQFKKSDIRVDGKPFKKKLDSSVSHDIDIVIAELEEKPRIKEIRDAVQTALALGSGSILLEVSEKQKRYAMTNQCVECGTFFDDLEPKHFNQKCSSCKNEGCKACFNTGMDYRAASVSIHGYRFTDLLALNVDEFAETLFSLKLPRSAKRLMDELQQRLTSLQSVGLGYVELNRPSPSLSRGESQRVRLAISLTSKLEDIVHLLDEPTIGQHPKDTERILPAFRDLPGPVIFIEHDAAATTKADRAIDLGPGAGINGGEIVFSGPPHELWRSSTTTGLYFSNRESVFQPERREPPTDFFTIRGASKHNLKGIDVTIPLSRFSVVTGVSGSGKSSLVEHVLVPSLLGDEPAGCDSIEGTCPSPVIVDQKPIGKNPRSNPGTYTKLSNVIRDIFAEETGLSKSHFSFNTEEGRCSECKGMGGIEVKMRYLHSFWITCSECEGKRFKEEVLDSKVRFGDDELSISDIYDLSIGEIRDLIRDEKRISENKRRSATRILNAMVEIGLGYLTLGQPSPTLSGGESQRVKLAKYLGKRSLKDKLLILDEPSTGLHPADLSGLLMVLDRLVRAGATLIVVEHNTDVVRSADWVVDLGPSSGPDGGALLFEGPIEELLKQKDSPTAEALRNESSIRPKVKKSSIPHYVSESISVRKAYANNLRNVSVDFPKGKLSVVTGVSGSGKSSLVRDVLQAEAERRFYETLSVYERQSTAEGPEAPVESVSGLGVTLSISSRRRRGAGYWSVYARRTIVGTVTELSSNLNVLFSQVGRRNCPKCGSDLARVEKWLCKKCGFSQELFKPRDFSSQTYASACDSCSGVGTRQIPIPEKLIIRPEKPICDGAMFSPGYFPRGYFCTQTSWAAGALVALGRRYSFDPKETPWKDISKKAKDAFLYGDPNKEPMEISYLGTRRGTRVEVNTKGRWAGFYKWVSDWDIGGTYTRSENCPACGGSGLKPQFLEVKLQGLNIHDYHTLALSDLHKTLKPLSNLLADNLLVRNSLKKMLTRLRFLESVGLGYLHLNRVASTLSAGEAQRLILSSLLGSGLTSLTILLDEPTRGMHPSEVHALVMALDELAKEGNSVIVVEHDSDVIRSADFIVDIGPGSGKRGGKILAKGDPNDLETSDTPTSRWLTGREKTPIPQSFRTPSSWMTVKGARENNLKDVDVRVPTDCLVGVCGVSGSGKSSFMIDTVARYIAPKKFTTSVSYEPVEPGEHDAIEGTPTNSVVLDQGRKGISSPGQALKLFKPLRKLFAESEDAKAKGYNAKMLNQSCTACDGRGRIRIEMGFLPDIFTHCETCDGTGYSQEVWEVKLKGVSLPELNDMALEDIYQLFKDEETVTRRLKPALDVGLGYLGLKQPTRTLSGGEIQRLKIAMELSKKSKPGTLYIFDEPTVGQHMEDVARLVKILNRLVEDRNGVIVIEHHPHLLAACDYLIEFGPKGGPEGGNVVGTGTPVEIAASSTPTSEYLREILEGSE